MTALAGKKQIRASAVLSDLPAGWQITTIGAVCSKPQYGWTTSAADSGTVKLLRTTDITHGPVDWSGVPYCLEVPADVEKYLLADGDIVVSRAGSVGFSCRVVAPERAVFASYLIRFRPKPEVIEGKYLEYLLQSPAYWAQVKGSTAGIALPNVNASKLAAFEIPLPPLAEQRRIVAEIEQQFTRLDAGVAALRRTQANLKRYHAAVLQAACEGSLLPSNSREWKPATLADVCAKITDGDHQPPPRAVEGVPFLTIGNISSRKLDFEKTRFVPQSYYDHIREDRIPRRNDIVYSVVGATIGIPVLVDTDRPFCFQRHIALLKPSPGILPKFLWLTMASPATFKAAWKGTTGTAQPTLPLRALRSLPMALPPLAEQTRIVAEVERRLSVVDELESLVKTNLQRATRLRQSILQQAFNEGLRS